jgi:hypothetical protein
MGTYRTFLAVPFLVVMGNGVAIIQEWPALQLAGGPSPGAVLPFEVSILMEALWWHPMYQHDPGHRAYFSYRGFPLPTKLARPIVMAAFATASQADRR